MTSKRAAAARPATSEAPSEAAHEPPLWTPAELIAILGRAYGRAPAQRSNAPVTELVLTLLSQHTSDHNSGRAMHRLLERFPSWDAVLEADPADIEEAIRPGGLAPTKSKRLVALLAEVKTRAPDWNLAMLRRMPLDDAKRWLTTLPGVGPKTAACVLLFALGRPALPVDTHVERVSKRLGLVPARTPADKAHDLLEAQLAPSEVYAFHVDLIQHGRRTCHARHPSCDTCPLLARCPRVGLPPR
ncbi:MAG: endonuclease III [Dehalococcoidia bacterium]|nr:endonuclease III [Dehalococcoidia bacterium]